MKTLSKVLYGLLGIALVAAVVLTMPRGLDPKDRAAYELALEQQKVVDGLGFPDLKLSDYPVAFHDGDKEYVLYQGQTRTRQPVLGQMTATAYEVDGHMEVLMPRMSDLATLTALSSGGNGSQPADQAALIWHETFHAWQMTKYADKLLGMLSPDDFKGDGAIGKDWQLIDNSPTLSEMMSDEMALLESAYQQQDTDMRKQALSKYFAKRADRLSLLPPHMTEVERFYELSEGGARYVEAKVFMELSSQAMYNDHYIAPAGQFEKGVEKYYRTGLIKCLLLDHLNPGWQSTFDATLSLDELIQNAL